MRRVVKIVLIIMAVGCKMVLWSYHNPSSKVHPNNLGYFWEYVVEHKLEQQIKPS